MISITNAAKEPHITPLQDSMWHRGMAGIDSCVFNFFENFAAEVSSNNSVKIRSGIGMIQGRYFCVEPSTYDEVTIANGTQGEKRKDLIVCRWTVDEEQKVQSGDWVVIQGTPTTGTPAAPSHTDGDLDAGDLIADMPFYEVTLDGINVIGVAQKFTSLGGIGKFPNPLPISKGGTGKTTAADALAALGGVQIKKVWTNDSPNSKFESREIPHDIDTTDCDWVVMIVRLKAGADAESIAENAVIFRAGSNGELSISGTISGRRGTAIRTASFGANNPKRYTIGGGVYFNDLVNTNDNDVCIPVAMYEAKGVI